MVAKSLVVEQVPDEVAREARAFNAQLEALLASVPSVLTVPAAEIRAARRAGKGIFPPPVFLPDLEDLEIATRAGALRLRIARPPGAAKGVYLHMHGGGWMLGGADMQDAALARMAREVGVVVASVDYRLSPEHPYPAGPDDCEDAARWLLDEGARVLGTPAVFAIGGESAGAHLSTVTLLRLGERARAFRAANLVYGAYDLSSTPSARAWGDRNLVLSGPIIAHFGAAFTGDRPLEQRRAPDLSPLFGDLRAMPPALFTVGTLDPLIDDTLFMEARWRFAGNATELRIWPDAIHGFNGFPIRLGQLADAAQHAFVARMLEG